MHLTCLLLWFELWRSSGRPSRRRSKRTINDAKRRRRRRSRRRRRRRRRGCCCCRRRRGFICEEEEERFLIKRCKMPAHIAKKKTPQRSCEELVDPASRRRGCCCRHAALRGYSRRRILQRAAHVTMSVSCRLHVSYIRGCRRVCYC